MKNKDKEWEKNYWDSIAEGLHPRVAYLRANRNVGRR